MVPIENLIPYANNSRTHSDKQVSQIAASIKEFGFTNPVLTDGDNGIIAGHGRVLAARKLKLHEVPTISLEHLSEPQRRAYVIADNKLALNAGWDEEILGIELEGLQELEFGLDVLGFEPSELTGLLGVGEPEEVGSGAPPPDLDDLAITVPGMVWNLGTHRLLCGDCTSAEVVERLMEGAKADQMVTDPPYGVDYSSKNEFLNAFDKGNRVQRPIENDAIEDYRTFFRSFLEVAPMASTNTVYMFMSSQESHNLRLAADDAGFYWSDWLVWLKNNHVLGRKDYNPKHEWIYYGWKGKHKFYGEFSTTILEYARPAKSDLHPTMKPPPLLARLIQDGSPKGALVYEPFGGSGSTLIACEMTGRVCRAIEISPHYCDVIVRRWQNETGLDATTEDGQTFAELEAVGKAA